MKNILLFILALIKTVAIYIKEFLYFFCPFITILLVMVIYDGMKDNFPYVADIVSCIVVEVALISLAVVAGAMCIGFVFMAYDDIKCNYIKLKGRFSK